MTATPASQPHAMLSALGLKLAIPRKSMTLDIVHFCPRAYTLYIAEGLHFRLLCVASLQYMGSLYKLTGR